MTAQERTWWQRWYYKYIYAWPPSLTTNGALVLGISIYFSKLYMKDIRDLALFCSSWSDSTTVRDNVGSEAKKEKEIKLKLNQEAFSSVIWDFPQISQVNWSEASQESEYSFSCAFLLMQVLCNQSRNVLLGFSNHIAMTHSNTQYTLITDQLFRRSKVIHAWEYWPHFPRWDKENHPKG